MNAIKAKFGPKRYHQNLLGEALEDLLRKATAKNLEVSDEVVNAQVVQAINEDAVHSPKEIASLLKKRLDMDNPQKQFLAVELVGKVLRECQIIAPHEEEVLQSVAAVMTRPGRNSPAAQRARGAARDLLRSYGRSGYDAIRQAARTNYAAARQGVGTPPMYTVGVPGGVGVPAGAPAVPNVVEKASLVDEVVRMVEAARGHTELLQDMLVNSSEPGVNEMESDLMRELLSEVRELRTLFNPYLEQLGALDGPEVEKAMCDALEAVDMLDNAIALHRDVAVELATQPAGTPGSSPTAAASAAPASAAVASSSGAAAAGPSSSSAPKPKSAEKDLIDLSDLGDSLPAASTSSPTKPPSSDPFNDPFTLPSPALPTTNSAPTPQLAPATSHTTPTSYPLGPPPVRQNPQQQPQPPPQQLPGHNSFPNYTPQRTPNSPGYPQHQQQQPYPMQQQMGGFPQGSMIGSPTHGPAAFSPPMSPTNFPYGGAAPMMPQQAQSMYPMMHMQVPQQQMPMYPGMPPPNMPPQMGMVPPQMSYMQPAPQMGFQDNAFAQPQQLPQQNSYNPPAAVPHNPHNPFASVSSPPPQQGQTAVDKEWDMLFTDKGVPQSAATRF